MLDWDVKSLTQTLVNIPSVTGEEGELVNFLVTFLSTCGFEIKTQEVHSDGARRNILAVGAQQPVVLLNSHLDTVPPFFKAQCSEDGQWLYGRGVCDAKGCIAAMICAAMELKQLGEERVALLFVVGEETDSSGAKAAVHFAPKVPYFIVGEPTELKLVRAMKGAVAFELVAQGIAGHSAYPASGVSAVHQLVHDMHALLHEPWPHDDILGATTLNMGFMEGGRAANVIADKACARGIMRASVPTQGLIEQITHLIHPQTAFNILSRSDPVQLHEVDGFETSIVSFGSDVPHLSPLGTPLMLGAGSILDAHTAHEKVRIADLEIAVSMYKRLCAELLKTAG